MQQSFREPERKLTMRILTYLLYRLLALTKELFKVILIILLIIKSLLVIC